MGRSDFLIFLEGRLVRNYCQFGVERYCSEVDIRSLLVHVRAGLKLYRRYRSTCPK